MRFATKVISPGSISGETIIQLGKNLRARLTRSFVSVRIKMSAYFVLSAATNLGLITSSASFLHATDKKKGERKTRRTKLSAKGCRNVIFRLTDQSPARFTDL